MIDCQGLKLDDARLALVVRASRRHRPPLPLHVTPEQLAALGAPDGYLDDVPVTTDAAVVPPPKVVPSVESLPRPIDDLRRERAAELQQTVRDYADSFISQDEQRDLQTIAAGLAEQHLYGGGLNETQQGVAVGLALARQWGIAAFALAGAAVAQCSACTTEEELANVTVDPTTLGEPPRITAGEVALVLRGA